MLTPKFELTQTETKVCIIVFAPYTNVSETEVYVEKNDFRFFSPPYYLRYVAYIYITYTYFMSVMLFFL
jgi:protein SHQ1